MAISLFRNFFEKKLWPDFNEKDYYKIIKKYKNIKRNFGKYLMIKEFQKRLISSIILIFILINFFYNSRSYFFYIFFSFFVFLSLIIL